MKTPYRYLVGIAAGLAAGFLFGTGDRVAEILTVVTDITFRLGRYLLLPLLFFSLTVAVTRLRRLGLLGVMLRRSVLYSVIAALSLTILGTLVAWLVVFGRLPVIPGTAADVSVVNLESMVQSTIRMNGFQVLTGDSSFLLPILVPAFILGWHMYHDREISEPAYNLFDSLSRLLYRANRFLLILMPGMLALITAATVVNSRRVVDFQRFIPVLGIVLLITVLLIGAVYPFLIWILGGRRSPWKVLFGLSGALLGAFISGSPLFNYGNLTRHLKENLKIPRHSSAVIAPLYLMFSRAGTAMIAAICMLTVIRSYSSLEITLFQAAWTALFSFLISFALPASPDRGLAAALVILGGLYGRGLDDGWLILAPALPLLIMLTAVLDTATGAMLLLIVSRKNGEEEADAVPALRF